MTSRASHPKPPLREPASTEASTKLSHTDPNTSTIRTSKIPKSNLRDATVSPSPTLTSGNIHILEKLSKDISEIKDTLSQQASQINKILSVQACQESAIKNLEVSVTNSNSQLGEVLSHSQNITPLIHKLTDANADIAERITT